MNLEMNYNYLYNHIKIIYILLLMKHLRRMQLNMTTMRELVSSILNQRKQNKFMCLWPEQEEVAYWIKFSEPKELVILMHKLWLWKKIHMHI